MIKNKLLRIAVLTLAVLMLLSFTAMAEDTAVSEDTTLTFGVFSDIHDQTSHMTNVMNSFETLAGGNENIDGIAMVGDIAYLDTNETPVAATYNIVKNNADLAYFIEADKLVYAMGNHEFPLNANSDPMASLSRQIFKEQVGYEPESHHILSGYHFITGGPNTYDGKMTAAQEQYVMDEVTKALEDGDNKPVFVLIHHPVDGTLHGAGTTRHSDEFVEFLKAEPRIIVFSGHMHYPESDPRSILQYEGGATFIYTSSVHGGNNLSNPYATQRHDKASPSQAYLMQVDTKTNVVTLKRFYVGSTPTYLEEGDWVLDIPAMVAESKKTEGEIDTENVYKYTYDVRKANSVAPVYKSGDAITVTSLTTKTISITYPEATPGAEGEDNLVGYYKVELYNKDTKETVTKKFISDYFLKMSSRRTSFSCSFDTLEYETDYTISVTPVNMWFVEGEPITYDFTSESAPSIIGRIMGYDDSYYAAPVTLNSTGNGYVADTENAFQLTDENNKKLSGLYAVSNDNFATETLAYAYGLVSERQAIHQTVNGKLPVIDDGSKGLFYPGKFSSNGYVGAAQATYFYSDTQWISRLVREYFSATDDAEGTEGGKTAAEKKLEIMSELIDVVKTQNQYVNYAFNTENIIPVSEVTSLKFGFYLNAVYSQVSMTIKDNAYSLTAYVIDEKGKVTTHSTSVGGITTKTGAVSYATFNFKTAEWDTPLPENGYLVGYRAYAYAGIDNPEDITLTTSKASVAEIDVNERLRFVAMPSTYTIDIPKADAPTGITVNGTTFNGLNKNITYSVAPYTIAGADNTKAVDVTGVTSYTLPQGSAGLYGFYIKGNGIDIDNSDAILVYVRGSYATRLDLHDRLDETAGKNYVGTYKVVSTVTPGSFSYTTDAWTGHSTFSDGNGISTTGDHISKGLVNTLYDKYTATYENDDAKNAALKDAFNTMLTSSKITSKYLQYNMASDEIVPISEMNKYSYKVSKERGGFSYKNQISEFVVLIMDGSGTVTGYTYQHVADNLSATTVTKTVDFKNKTSAYGTWMNELPKEGYVVGFQYKIYANLDNFANVDVSSSTTGTRYMIVPTTSYVIDVPKADAPTGITVEGTSFKGLVASKTYAIAPYTIHGLDTTLEKTVTGVTEYNVAEAFGGNKGIYFIYFKGDGVNYVDSDCAAICYVQGTAEEKKNVIFTDDGLYNVYPANWAKINDWSIGNLSAPLSTTSAGTFGVPCDKATILSTWFFPKSTNTNLETHKANLPKVRYSYAYNPEEIPTVDELGGFTFRIQRQNSPLNANVKAKVNFVVLHPDATVTNHSVMTSRYTFKNGSSNSFTINFQNFTDLPEEGWVLGFEVFPFGEVETLSYTNETDFKTYGFNNLGLYFYFESYSLVEKDPQFGMSLLLDGKVGVKVTAISEEASGFTVSNVVGTDNYDDFGTNDHAVFYFDPKDVADAKLSFNVTYTKSGSSVTECYALTIADYIDALKKSSDAEVVALATAFDNYFNAADAYFDDTVTEVEALPDLTEEELQDLASKSNQKISGTVAGLDYHGTSLVLEEDTTIRHYFKITDDSIENEADLAQRYTVTGGTALKFAKTNEGAQYRYAYTDVADISSNELSTVKTVTVTDKQNNAVTVDFSAITYVERCLDESDVEYQNMIKALYRYSVESDEYMTK